MASEITLPSLKFFNAFGVDENLNLLVPTDASAREVRPLKKGDVEKLSATIAQGSQLAENGRLEALKLGSYQGPVSRGYRANMMSHATIISSTAVVAKNQTPVDLRQSDGSIPPLAYNTVIKASDGELLYARATPAFEIEMIATGDQAPLISINIHVAQDDIEKFGGMSSLARGFLMHAFGASGHYYTTYSHPQSKATDYWVEGNTTSNDPKIQTFGRNIYLQFRATQATPQFKNDVFKLLGRMKDAENRHLKTVGIELGRNTIDQEKHQAAVLAKYSPLTRSERPSLEEMLPGYSKAAPVIPAVKIGKHTFYIHLNEDQKLELLQAAAQSRLSEDQLSELLLSIKQVCGDNAHFNYLLGYLERELLKCLQTTARSSLSGDQIVSLLSRIIKTVDTPEFKKYSTLLSLEGVTQSFEAAIQAHLTNDQIVSLFSKTIESAQQNTLGAFMMLPEAIQARQGSQGSASMEEDASFGFEEAAFAPQAVARQLDLTQVHAKTSHASNRRDQSAVNFRNKRVSVRNHTLVQGRGTLTRSAMLAR